MRRGVRRLCGVSGLAVLAGCAQVAPGLPPAPPPLAAAPAYRVQVGDVLAIRLYLEPELNEEVTVRPDGRISTALAPSITAEGRTTDELAEVLRRAYASELQRPVLSVEVKSAVPARVYVAGEVTAAGEFVSSGPPPTLVQAVARAGGLRIAGDADHVFVIRRGPGDRPQAFAANYRAAILGADPSADVRLAPYDIVYVPKTGINAAYVWFNQHVQQFVPVSWGFSYNVNPLVNAK